MTIAKQHTELYRLYRTLFRSSFRLHAKKKALEEAAVDIAPWVVSSISEDALRHLAEHKHAIGLRRGHHVSRAERARQIFERPTPLGIHEFIPLFFEQDKVSLVTQSENGREGTQHWSALYPVPPGYFAKGSFRVNASKADIQWAVATLPPIRSAG